MVEAVVVEGQATATSRVSVVRRERKMEVNMTTKPLHWCPVDGVGMFRDLLVNCSDTQHNFLGCN